MNAVTDAAPSVGLRRRVAARLKALYRISPLALLLVLLVLAVFVAVRFGAVTVTGDDWWRVITQFSEAKTGGAYVLWDLRLPRALFALVVGAALGFSGALAQGLFRNPLADPGLLGVSAGAACVVALGIVAFNGIQLSEAGEWQHWGLPGFAFFGAIGVCLLLDVVARFLAPGSISGLLLTGIALNALVGAVISLCTALANDEQLRSLTFWMLGSLGNARWDVALLILGVLVLAWWRIRRLRQAMNALALGEHVAAQVGIEVSRLRKEVLLLIAVLCGLSVAWCGMIGFIGLIAPNLIRIWLGADQRHVLPLSALLGGALLLFADTLARNVAIPAEVPVGVFTSLLGVPFFLLLLLRSRGRLS